MGHDTERFLERFTAFGAGPGTSSYLALFHRDATLHDAGMEKPLRVPEIPAHIEGILALVPDFRMTPERWREREGTVFVEALNRATVAGREARWRSIYCVDLAGDLVMRGRRYYDRRALYTRLDPNLPALPPYEPVAEEPRSFSDPLDGAGEIVRAVGETFGRDDSRAWLRLFREDATLVGPDLPRPISRNELAPHHRAVRSRLSELDLELLEWAGDDALAFAEWRLRGQSAGVPLTLDVATRLDLAGGLILAARAYFDTLGLATALAAAPLRRSRSA
jgi:ketosteroid isomerase-like protein